ncbi:LacI family DNA-binding transcriptional regulator [Goodfellowiella coeruleoviolacea]|nr:LacI family DNA-binding transcriptional regulator [Goodfellowiella coeruleoviolacea]
MRDVAELAGVSITTVSHVVNGTRAVAEATKQRVLDAVEATGYTGNAIARSLATGGTRSLGVAISLVVNPYFAELIQVIEGEAARAGFTLLLVDTHDTPDTTRAAVHMLRSRRVDGLLLTPSPGPLSTALPDLHQLKTPIVLVDRLSGEGVVDQVGPENVGATAALVGHVAARGHRRIALISGAAGLATTAERTQGYRLGLRRAGLAFAPELVVCGESSAEPARAALHRLLDLDQPPTAVVSGNNRMTVGVLRAAGDRGLRIGRDLAVVGYDDVEWAELVDPPLTTIAQPITDIGRTAVRLLLDRITHPDRPARTVRLPGRLVHRRSCGCP